MRHPACHIFQFTPDSLEAWCIERGMKPFRARQILEWVYRHGVVEPERMSNLSKADREVLSREMTFHSGEVLRHEVASDGTQKLLVEWVEAAPRRHEGAEAPSEERSQATTRRRDELRGEGALASLAVLNSGAAGSVGDPSRQTECVMIPSTDKGGVRRTACISSQVGCPVGCRFCASGLGGLDANLSAGRIVEQVWLLDRMLKQQAIQQAGAGPSHAPPEAQLPRITNVVFMGMGEPLANFAPVMQAVRTLAAEWGMGLSARKITISTVGLPKAIERLADQLELPVTLALSLHAPNDELRRQLIPWAEYTSIGELLAACDRWFQKTGREITLEYILLGGLNDRPEHAEQLARLAGSLRGNVNLIRYNEVAGLPFVRPADADVRRFQQVLRERGVNAHIRASRGRDIAAACGQLRHEASA